VTGGVVNGHAIKHVRSALAAQLVFV